VAAAVVAGNNEETLELEVVIGVDVDVDVDVGVGAVAHTYLQARLALQSDALIKVMQVACNTSSSSYLCFAVHPMCARCAACAVAIVLGAVVIAVVVVVVVAAAVVVVAAAVVVAADDVVSASAVVAVVACATNAQNISFGVLSAHCSTVSELSHMAIILGSDLYFSTPTTQPVLTVVDGVVVVVGSYRYSQNNA